MMFSFSLLKLLLLLPVFCHQFVFSFNLELTEDRTILFNGKKLGGKISKIKRQKDKIFVITYRRGLYELSSSGFKSIASPISPVFNHPRQLEDGDFSSTSPLVITRNRLVKLMKKGHRYLDLKGVRKGSRLTSLCQYNGKLYLGTSFNGVYVKDLNPSKTQDKENNHWEKIASGLPREKYSWGEYFYDDIRSLFVNQGELYAYCEYSRRIYKLDKVNSRWKPLSFKGIDEIIVLDAICVRSGNQWRIFKGDELKSLPSKLINNNKSWVLDEGKITEIGRFQKKYPFKTISQYGPIQKDIKSLYINLDFITYSEMDVITNLLAKKVVNALVINFKDDTGNLIYGSKLPMAKKVKSSMTHFKLKDLYKRLKPINPYIICRLVTFKDYRLYKYNDNQYALRDKRSGEPWKVNGHEYWVDPFSKEVQHYNLSVAKELQDRADEFLINEIQFDYIRFPSDKEIRYVHFRHRGDQWERYDILESFLSKVTNALRIPFSLDIYGYNGIYRMGNVIGQDIETISKYAPIICPMHYPSHFGSVYLSSREGSKEYNLLRFALERANDIVYKDTIIRPYLQAFTYKAKNFGEKYIRDQVQGSLDGGAKGVGFWHPSSKYSIIKDYLINVFK